MDQMDNEAEFDMEDAAWHQQELEGRRRREEEMLRADPGYFQFLQTFAQEP